MANVVEKLKEEVKKTPEMLLCDTPYLNRESKDVFPNQNESTLLILKEVAYVMGKIKVFRRIFLKNSGAEDYCWVGWVIDGDMDNCMICGRTFFLFDKHHCRICGDIVCESCSSEQVQLSEFMHWGFQRACRMCHFGQDIISVHPFRHARQIQLANALKGDNFLNSSLATKLENPEYVKPALGANGSQHVTVDLQGGSRKPTTAELQFLSSVSVFHDGGNDVIANEMALHELSSDDDDAEGDDEFIIVEDKVNAGAGYDIYSGASSGQWQRRRVAQGESSEEDDEEEAPMQFASLTEDALQALQARLEDESSYTESTADIDMIIEKDEQLDEENMGDEG